MTPDVRELADVIVAPPRSSWKPCRGLRKQNAARSASTASRSTGSRTRPTRSTTTPWRRSSTKGRRRSSVIKWKEIYENLENATDRCEDVANIIEGVVLKHA